MRLLGVDYGRRRIGVAVTDPTGVCVRGVGTIDRDRTGDPIAAISEYVHELGPEKIVFGLPLGPDDEETAMSSEVRAFAAIVAEATGLAIDFVDESHTSRRAQDILLSRRRKHRRNKQNRDRIAACLILESYLGVVPYPGLPPE
jgi:putative Holliday junction resolvase